MEAQSRMMGFGVPCWLVAGGWPCCCCGVGVSVPCWLEIGVVIIAPSSGFGVLPYFSGSSGGKARKSRNRGMIVMIYEVSATNATKNNALAGKVTSRCCDGMADCRGDVVERLSVGLVRLAGQMARRYIQSALKMQQDGKFIRRTRFRWPVGVSRKRFGLHLALPGGCCACRGGKGSQADLKS